MFNDLAIDLNRLSDLNGNVLMFQSWQISISPVALVSALSAISRSLKRGLHHAVCVILLGRGACGMNADTARQLQCADNVNKNHPCAVGKLNHPCAGRKFAEQQLLLNVD